MVVVGSVEQVRKKAPVRLLSHGIMSANSFNGKPSSIPTTDCFCKKKLHQNPPGNPLIDLEFPFLFAYFAFIYFSLLRPSIFLRLFFCPALDQAPS